MNFVPVPGPWLRHVARVVVALALTPVFAAVAVVALVTLTLGTLAWSWTPKGREHVQGLWRQFFQFVVDIVKAPFHLPTDPDDAKESSAPDDQTRRDLQDPE
jgi:hypothetical protein